MKYQAGQKVRVRTDLNVELLRHVSVGFIGNMDRYIGKIVYITQAYGGGTSPFYRVHGYNFDEDWLEPANNDVTIIEED